MQAAREPAAVRRTARPPTAARSRSRRDGSATARHLDRPWLDRRHLMAAYAAFGAYAVAAARASPAAGIRSGPSGPLRLRRRPVHAVAPERPDRRRRICRSRWPCSRRCSGCRSLIRSKRGWRSSTGPRRCCCTTVCPTCPTRRSPPGCCLQPLPAGHDVVRAAERGRAWRCAATPGCGSPSAR